MTRHTLPTLLTLSLAAGMSIPALAAPQPWADACVLRAEAPQPAGETMVPPAPAQSSIGWRRQHGQLFDVAITVVGPDSVCSIGGVARQRSGADGDTLVFPIRPDRAARAGAPLCLVSLRTSGQAVEVSTSPACQSQAVCGGRLQLQGQRFDLGSAADTASASAGAPCFEPAALRR